MRQKSASSEEEKEKTGVRDQDVVRTVEGDGEVDGWL